MNQPQQQSAEEVSARLNAEFQDFLKSEEYQAALYHESADRDSVWLPVPQVVCGIDLRPLTARDLLALFFLRSPFLSASFLDGSRQPLRDWPEDAPEDFPYLFIPEAEVARFLWIHSYAFTPRTGGKWSQWRSERRRHGFTRKCRGIPYGTACGEIRDYINGALADSPGGKSGTKTGPSVASWVSSDIHLLASEYGWTADYVLDLPLAQLFQCERRIMVAHGEKALGNRSDKLRAEWLRGARKRYGLN